MTYTARDYNFADTPQKAAEVRYINHGLIHVIMKSMHKRNTRIESIFSLGDTIRETGLSYDEIIPNMSMTNEDKHAIINVADAGVRRIKDSMHYKYTQLGPLIKISDEACRVLAADYRGVTCVQSRRNEFVQVDHSTLLTDTTLRQKFNEQQGNSRGFTYLHYRDTSKVPNVIPMFNENGGRRVELQFKAELVVAVTNAEDLLATVTENNTIEDYDTKIPYYFIIAISKPNHFVSLVKLGDKYYSVGYSFIDKKDTVQCQYENDLSTWTRANGAITSPDDIFTVNIDTDESAPTFRVVDFGILQTMHLSNIKAFMGDVRNIYIQYEMGIPLNSQCKFRNMHEKVYHSGTITPRNITFELENVGYNFSGRCPVSNRNRPYYNCSTFLAYVFTGRLTPTGEHRAHDGPVSKRGGLWCGRIYRRFFQQASRNMKRVITYDELTQLVCYDFPTSRCR